MKSYLVYFSDDSQVTINASQLQVDGTVIKLLNGTDLVAVLPLDALQGVVDVTALEDEDDDEYSEDDEYADDDDESEEEADRGK